MVPASCITLFYAKTLFIYKQKLLLNAAPNIEFGHCIKYVLAFMEDNRTFRAAAEGAYKVLFALDIDGLAHLT